MGFHTVEDTEADLVEDISPDQRSSSSQEKMVGSSADKALRTWDGAEDPWHVSEADPAA